MSRIAVVGAGPIGLFISIALARRGHEVSCIDRDPGSESPASWRRAGVMQFDLPHFFRHPTRLAFLAEMPDVLDSIVAAGAVPTPIPGMPEEFTSIACRRSVLEHALRRCASIEPGLSMVIGHAANVLLNADRIVGIQVDGRSLEVDLVVSSAGRASHFGDELRAKALGGACGFAYASRMYRARPGVAPPDLPIPSGVTANGYFSILFPQDDNTLSALIVRPTDDRVLTQLRELSAYEAAVAAIPNLAPWTDQENFEPIGPVLAGAGLNNAYRSQGVAPGVPPARGLYFIGDAVLNTNPAAGRGVSLGLIQAQYLLALLDDRSLDPTETSVAFDAWTEAEMKPWFDDHVYWDQTLLQRFAGHDLDVESRLPSDIICAAAEVAPSILRAAGPYLGMMVGPSALDAVEEEAREVLRTGWRPAWVGPSRDELADIVLAAV